MRADDGSREDGRALSRRSFLAASGGAGLAIALAGLPDALARHGWLDEAAAAESDLTRDTISGLAAFIIPGNDEYSVAQGVSTPDPGAVGAGTVTAVIDALDNYVPTPLTVGSSSVTIPASGGVANLLNAIAMQVNPGASAGGFASAFARLSFAEKGEVFRRFESDPTFADSEFRFVAGILPGFVGFLGFTEAGVYADGKLTGRPVGWQVSGYGGPSEGWKEFKGYWGGRRAARDGHRFVKHRHRRPRRRRRRRRRRA